MQSRFEQLNECVAAASRRVQILTQRWEDAIARYHAYELGWSETLRCGGDLRIARRTLALLKWERRAEGRRTTRPSEACGHSVCRQNWIDTGDSSCVREVPAMVPAFPDGRLIPNADRLADRR